MIALLVVGAILWVWLSDTFYVTRISVAGNALTPAQEIVQTSGIGGQHMFWVNHAAASERIVNGIPSIKSARVDCQLPNRCVIKVQERQPSVAWRFGGAVTWIADDGMAFAAHRDTDLPLITIDAPQGPALLPGKEADQRIVKAAVAVAKATAECAPVQIHDGARTGISERARFSGLFGSGRQHGRSRHDVEGR